MTKMYETGAEEDDKKELAIINAITKSEPMVETLIKQHQTCKKSTGGLLKYSNSIQPRQSFLDLERRTNSRSISNDSSTNVIGDDMGGGGGGGVLSSPQTGGIKLVFKRAIGSNDKYEVKNAPASSIATPNYQLSMSLNEKMLAPLLSSQTSSSRPKRAASRKVKFIFKDYETDFDNLSSARKRLKLTHASTLDPLSNSMSETHTSFGAFIRQNTFPDSNTTVSTLSVNNNNNIDAKKIQFKSFISVEPPLPFSRYGQKRSSFCQVKD
jgi:hypothetical protein